MRKHTSVLCVENHLEGKMYSQSTISHEKENGKQKEIKNSDPLPPVKKQRMTTEFVLIPKHKYEQLEKDTSPKQWKFTWTTTILTTITTITILYHRK